MVSDLKTFTKNEFKIAAQKSFFRDEFSKDQEAIRQGLGSYITRIRRLYNKDQHVMFSDAILKPLQKTLAYKGCNITEQKKKFICEFCLTSRIFWYRCYYPHWSRDAFSPICGIFLFINLLRPNREY